MTSRSLHRCNSVCDLEHCPRLSLGRSTRISTLSKKSFIDQLEVEDHVGGKDELVMPSSVVVTPAEAALETRSCLNVICFCCQPQSCAKISFIVIVAGCRRAHAPLKREESVRAERYLIFVAVVEDCLARVVVADLRPKQ